MTHIIYYVGLRLAPDSDERLRSHLDRHHARPMQNLHTTIIYSRDTWFTYKADLILPINIVPPYETEMWRKVCVLIFKSPEIVLRHQAFRAAGATHDYHYRTHITLSKDDLVPPPRFPLTFDTEYYGTWKE